MNDVQIYADENILELFDDENIIINLKQVDIRDIATNYSSYTQTFTIPASPVNNKALKYWFDVKNDIQVSNIGIASRVDIGGVFYKKGTLKLMSFQTNDRGDYKSYTVQFTTLLKGLKDIFGDVLISQLDYSTVMGSNIIPFDDAAVHGSFSNTILNKDIEIPLISSLRNFTQYSDFKYDPLVFNPLGIKRGELRPAIKMSKILAGIENKYGINFTGGFIDSGRLDKLYMWLNKSNSVFDSGGIVISTNGTFTNTNYIEYSDLHDYVSVIRYDSPANLNGDSFTYKFKISINVDMSNTTTEYIGKIQQVILNADGTVNEMATADQFNFGIVSQSAEYRKGDQNNLVEYSWSPTTEPIGTKKTFRFIAETKDADTVALIDSEIKIQRTFSNPPFRAVNTTTIASTVSTLLQNRVTISENLPELKIQDFLTSIIKMFNLVILPMDDNVYQLEYFTDFYATGKILDITKYCTSTKKINKIKTYKKLTFTHAESSYWYNISYKKAQKPAREYGAITAEYVDGDTDEYKIESKFNLMNFRELSGVDFADDYFLNNTWIVGDAAGENNSVVTNKPTIFFYNGFSEINESKYIAYSVAPSTNYSITNYPIFSNIDDLAVPTTSLAFSSENMLDSGQMMESLFKNGYADLVKSIYSNYAREFEIEANLPRHIFTTLSLNNQIVISNENYTITDIQLNIINGNAKLKLNNVIR